MQECNKSLFESEYDSVGECQEDVKSIYDDLFDSCDYDAPAGRKCIRKMHSDRKECSSDEDNDEQFDEACEDVYEDCSPLDRSEVVDASVGYALEQLPKSVR